MQRLDPSFPSVYAQCPSVETSIPYRLHYLSPGQPTSKSLHAPGQLGGGSILAAAMYLF